MHTLTICALRAFIAPSAQCALTDIYCTLCTLCILCAQCTLCTLKPFFFNSTPKCTHWQYVHFVHSLHPVHNVHFQTYIAPCALCVSYAPNAPCALWSHSFSIVHQGAHITNMCTSCIHCTQCTLCTLEPWHINTLCTFVHTNQIMFWDQCTFAFPAS